MLIMTAHLILAPTSVLSCMLDNAHKQLRLSCMKACRRTLTFMARLPSARIVPSCIQAPPPARMHSSMMAPHRRTLTTIVIRLTALTVPQALPLTATCHLSLMKAPYRGTLKPAVIRPALAPIVPSWGMPAPPSIILHPLATRSTEAFSQHPHPIIRRHTAAAPALCPLLLHRPIARRRTSFTRKCPTSLSSAHQSGAKAAAFPKIVRAHIREHVHLIVVCIFSYASPRCTIFLLACVKLYNSVPVRSCHRLSKMVTECYARASGDDRRLELKN